MHEVEPCLQPGLKTDFPADKALKIAKAIFMKWIEGMISNPFIQLSYGHSRGLAKQVRKCQPFGLASPCKKVLPQFI